MLIMYAHAYVAYLCAHKINQILHGLKKYAIWQHRESQPYPCTFWGPFRISIQACTLLNGHHPVGRPLASDPSANNLATPTDRTTSPLQYGCRTPTREQRIRLRATVPVISEKTSGYWNCRKYSLYLHSNSQSAKQTLIHFRIMGHSE